MRIKDIHGNYISNAIGFCHYEKHSGALNHHLAYVKKCKAKKCRHLEMYSTKAWEKQKYKNRKR